MKNKNTLMLVVALTSGAVLLQAEPSSQTPAKQSNKSVHQPAPATDMQIVYFDGLEVFNKSLEVKKAKEDLDAKFREEGAKLQALRAEAEKLANDLKNMGSVATEQAKRNKQEESLKKNNEVSIKEQSLQQYAQEEMQRAEYQLAQKLKDYATKVAQEKGYSIVLAGGVAYADPKLNISNEIIAEWDKDFLAKSAPDKSAPKKSTP